jgi:hypothetical protein
MAGYRTLTVLHFFSDLQYCKAQKGLEQGPSPVHVPRGRSGQTASRKTFGIKKISVSFEL